MVHKASFVHSISYNKTTWFIWFTEHKTQSTGENHPPPPLPIPQIPPNTLKATHLLLSSLYSKQSIQTPQGYTAIYDIFPIAILVTTHLHILTYDVIWIFTLIPFIFHGVCTQTKIVWKNCKNLSFFSLHFPCFSRKQKKKLSITSFAFVIVEKISDYLIFVQHSIMN